MGKQRDPWFLEMSPHHPAHYGAYPEYLFHHEKGAATDAGLVFQAPHLSMPQGLNEERVLNRVALRDGLEKQSRIYEAMADDGSFDNYRQAALSLLTNSKVHDAFDLEKADPKSLDRYGRNSFGWSLLMARQLVETGVSLVQVNLGNNETWDTHQAAFPNLKNFLLPPMDRAVSALLDDLDARGLLDETLVVMGSEFGRTPKISKIAGASLPGRDHWGASQTVFLAGGGVRGGTVIGATDRNGAYPADAPQRPENLAATIYEALGLPRTVEWHDPLERPHSVYEAEPIKGLT
jgi:arylsulfatase A-like enzyme